MFTALLLAGSLVPLVAMLGCLVVAARLRRPATEPARRTGGR